MVQVSLAQFPTYSVDDYLALEQISDIKHEYVDGVIVAMVGTSKAHDVIVHNLQRVLANYLQGTPCRVAGSDLKLYVAAANRFFYPDLMVVCSDPTVGDPYVETDAKLIIEVLSTKTAEYDREIKGEAYRQLPGLLEYLLIAQDRAEVRCYRRTDAGWEEHGYGPGDTVPVLEGGLSVSMATIYERLNISRL